MLRPRRRTPAIVSVQQKKKEPKIGRNASSKATGHRAAPHTAVRRAPTGHTTIHKGTMRCEHRNNHQMRRTPSEPSANTSPPPPLQGAHAIHKGRGCAPRAGRCPPRGWQQGRDQPTAHGIVHVVRRCEILVWGGGGAGGWGRSGCAKGAPRSANTQGWSNTDTQNARATPGGTRASTAEKEEGHSKAGEATRTAGTGNQNGGDGRACAWEATPIKGMLAWSRRYWVPGQPLLNRHQVGGVSRSPDGLSAQQEREPIRGRPAVRGKRTYGGRPGQGVEEHGTWASRTQKHSEAGYGRPVERGAWTAKTVKRPRQQPAHPQYATYWAPQTRKWHTMPHSAQPQHTKYWAP